MKALSIFAVFLLGGCSVRSFYPTIGGVVGGAAGSIGGPVVAAASAGAGVMVGEMAKGNADLEEAKDTIKALSKGDVEGLIAAGLGEQKGFVDNAIDAVMDTIKLVCIGLLIWNIVPIVYTRFVHKKANNGNSPKAV